MGEHGFRPDAPGPKNELAVIEKVAFMDPQLAALAWVNFQKRKNNKWSESENFGALVREIYSSAEASAGDNVNGLLGGADVEQSVVELKTYLASYEYKSKDKLLDEIELLTKTFEREYRAVIDTMDAADLSNREREQCVDFLLGAKLMVESTRNLNLSERIMYLNRAIAEVERARRVIVAIVSRTK